MDGSKKKVLLLLGTTASGKSAILKSLSSFIDFEFISADSIQVYRGLDIGSAKPTREEQGLFPHHLIDIRNFDEAYSVGDFVHDADECVSAITERKRLPIISGGTVFYIKNFLYGLSDTPESDKEVRARLMDEKNRLGLLKMYEKVRQIDIEYADKLSPCDEQRIIRALEIYETTGKKVSDFKLPSTIRTSLDVKIFAISETKEQNEANIQKRIDEMFKLGLTSEITTLKQKGATADMQSMKGIGYREFFNPDNKTESDLKKALYDDTRHYAKRQRTFLKTLPGVRYETRENMLNAILSEIKGWIS